MSEGSSEGTPKPSPRDSGLRRIIRPYQIEFSNDYDRIPPEVYEANVQLGQGIRDALVRDVGDVLGNHIPVVRPEGQPTRILDIAAGTGLLSRELATRGYSVTALDMSRRHLDYLRTKEPSIQTLVADMNERLPVEDESFDGVTELKANRYIRNTGRFLREVHRVLKPGGSFVWPIFSVESPFWKIKSGIRQHTSSRSLAQEAGNIGFETDITDRVVDLPISFRRHAPISYVIARK